MIDTMNHVAHVWWSLSVSLFWQVGLLIGVIACADILLRRCIWPQIRYALWLMVLVKLVLPPGLYSPGSVTRGVQPLAQKLTVASPVGQQANESPELYHVLTTPTPWMEMDRAWLNASGQGTIAPSIQIVEADIQTPDSPSFLASLHWHVYTMGLWIVVTGTFGLWLAARLRRLRQGLPRSRHSLPASFYEQLGLCARRVGLKTVPIVIITDRVIVPAVMGTWHPVLLMPHGFLRQLSRQDTMHMLLHELSHIKRGDLWVHSAYMILQVIHWYNPLLWLVSRQMHHLRELCCDATVAGLLKEHTMAYRNTLLDVARRYLSRPTEPSLGLLGLFEDTNRLAARLNWLKKDTHRFRKTRTLSIVLLVGLMGVCVLPMAQAEDTPATPQKETTEVVEIHTTTSEGTPDEYSEAVREIEFLKQHLAAKDKEADKATLFEVDIKKQPSDATDQGKALSNTERQGLRQQMKALERQQQMLAQQLAQLRAALDRPEEAVLEQSRLKKDLQAQLKHLDKAKVKLKDIQQHMVESEKLRKLSESVNHMAHGFNQWVDVNDVQVWVKGHVGKLPVEIMPQIRQWADSDEMKSWQDDMTTWKQNMEAWGKAMAKVTEEKIQNFKPGGTPLDHSAPSMPPMPAMPSMPVPGRQALDVLPSPGTPQPHPDVRPHVQVETHVVAPHPSRIVKHRTHVNTPNLVHIEESESQSPSHAITQETESLFRIVKPKSQRSTEARAELTKSMVLSFPVTECQSVTLANGVGDISVLGTEGNQCRVEVKITAKAKDATTVKQLAEQVHIRTGRDKKVLTIAPEVPNNSNEAQVTVAFTLKVPRTMNLNLTTQVGDMTVRNMQSQINCHANVGNIRVQATAHLLNANTNVGDIVLDVTDDTDATISALSNIGRIQSKHAFTLSPENKTGAKGTLSLGAGETPVNLRVNVGSIHVGSHPDTAEVGKSKTRSETYPRTTTLR